MSVINAPGIGISWEDCIFATYLAAKAVAVIHSIADGNGVPDEAGASAINQRLFDNAMKSKVNAQRVESMEELEAFVGGLAARETYPLH